MFINATDYISPFELFYGIKESIKHDIINVSFNDYRFIITELYEEGETKFFTCRLLLIKEPTYLPLYDSDYAPYDIHFTYVFDDITTWYDFDDYVLNDLYSICAVRYAEYYAEHRSTIDWYICYVLGHGYNYDLFMKINGAALRGCKLIREQR